MRGHAEILLARFCCLTSPFTTELRDDFKTISELKLGDSDTGDSLYGDASAQMQSITWPHTLFSWPRALMFRGFVWRPGCSAETIGWAAVNWVSRPASADGGDPDAHGGSRSDGVAVASDLDSGTSEDRQMRLPHYVVSRIYFSEIFKMLDSAPPSIPPQLWDLLMYLPTNAQILKEIRDLGPSWRSSLIGESVYGLLYSLQVIERLLDESSATGGQWALQFIENGGLDLVLQIILSSRFESPDSVQSSESLALLLKLISTLTFGEAYARPGSEMRWGILLLSQCLGDGKGLDGFVHKLMDILSASARAYVPNPKQASALDSCREKVGTFALDLLTVCAVESAGAMLSIYRYSAIDTWISHVFLQNGSAPLRQALVRSILQIAASGAAVPHASAASAAQGAGGVGGAGHDQAPAMHPQVFFLEQILPLVEKLSADNKAHEHVSARCTDLFNLAIDLLRLLARPSDPDAMEVEAQGLDQLTARLDGVAHSLGKSLMESSVVEERHSAKDDHILIGVLRTLECLVSLNPELKRRLGSSSGMNLVRHIFVNCLFSVPTIEHHEVDGPPKCKLQKSRQAAFDLLLRLVDGCLETHTELLDLLLQQYSR